MSDKDVGEDNQAIPTTGVAVVSLDATDVDNLQKLLGRVELKGSEARIYVGLELKLNAIKQAVIAEE